MERRLCHVLDAFVRGNVGGDGDRVGAGLVDDLAPRRLERRLATRAHDERRSLGRQLARHGAPEPFARRRDERDLAAQSEIHGYFLK
jgi:hypothetical protein